MRTGSGIFCYCVTVRSTVLQYNFHGYTRFARYCWLFASICKHVCDHICSQEMSDKTVYMTDKKKRDNMYVYMFI